MTEEVKAEELEAAAQVPSSQEQRAADLLSALFTHTVHCPVMVRPQPVGLPASAGMRRGPLLGNSRFYQVDSYN